ncbi:MAG: glycosyltransferase family 4 protein [Acidocella sp.]|nr:glycosyltransferase family 4 protein [Acidocella sp.]
MKILYLNFDHGIPVCGDKGASVHVRSFIAAAHRLGHHVALACSTLGTGNPPPPALILPPCPRPRATHSDAAEKQLDRELVKLAADDAAPAHVLAALEACSYVPDLIYERHALLHGAGVTIAARLGVPRLLEVNAPLVDEQKRFRGLVLEDEARAIERRSYQNAAAIIAVSEAVGCHVGEVLGQRQYVHVVPNGVDLIAYARNDEARKALRERLALPAHARLAGFIGSFKSWHGVPFLIEAFAAIANEIPELYLAAIGEGPEHGAVAARAAALGLSARVLLPGRVPHAEVPTWLAAMDFTVAPYLPQPDFYFSPLKIAESMAAARPVLAPDTGAISQMISHRRSGLLFPPGDLAACTVGLAELSMDVRLCEAMGLQARHEARQWGWEQVVTHSLGLAGNLHQHQPAA